jgi:glycosyltransferase involved in cell wall biosynthesis
VALARADGPSKRIDALPRITIVGYKNRPLAQALARKLQGQGVEHTLLTGFRPREAFLEQLAASSIAVCIPRLEEGFYLPALEAMASGCLLVTSDCIGNRSFCHHEGNCLIAEPTADALLDATLRVLALSHKEKQRLLQAARQTVLEHSLETQRARFREVLADIDQLW